MRLISGRLPRVLHRTLDTEARPDKDKDKDKDKDLSKPRYLSTSRRYDREEKEGRKEGRKERKEGRGWWWILWLEATGDGDR